MKHPTGETFLPLSGTPRYLSEKSPFNKTKNLVNSSFSSGTG